jgi:ribosomal protein S12 methylthiotransferase accessory factor
VPRCSAAELAHPRCPVTAPDPAAPIRWVRGVDLHTGRLRWIPAVLVYLHIVPASPGERFHLPISTGCAAHPDLATALVNAACEVVERDAISLTWLQRLGLPRIELDSVSPYLRGFLDVAAERDLRTYLFDATTDVGIPTVYSVEVAPAHSTCATVVMCATDLDPQRAVAKVLREAASARIALQVARPAAADLDSFATVYDGAVHMGRPEHTGAFDFLLRSPRRRPLSAMPLLASGDPATDLDLVLRRLRALDLAAYAVDLTTDEALRAGMHVVRAVVPGLQPLSFSYRCHPRLYQAPARMGHPVHPEDGINPWPQPFA